METERRRTRRGTSSVLLRCLFGANLLAVLLSGCGLQAEGAESLYSTFQRLRVPDFVPISTSTMTIRVELNGNLVKPADPIPARNFRQLDIMKGVTWDSADAEAVHTLMLLDIDRKASSNGTLNVYNQYTSINIPSNHIVNGQAIVAFDAPNVPCQPSTKHRLVMLAFQQDQNIDLADIAYVSAAAGPSARRENFRLDEFTKRHRLHLVAANVFWALGEINGVCSGAQASNALAQNQPLLTSMLFLMVILQQASLLRPTTSRQP